MKSGKRKSVNTQNKKRIDEITRILEELDYLAVELIKHALNEKITINKEEIRELAQEWSDMPIGDLEVSILWSKLNDFERRANEYRKVRRDESEVQPIDSTTSGEGEGTSVPDDSESDLG